MRSTLLRDGMDGGGELVVGWIRTDEEEKEQLSPNVDQHRSKQVCRCISNHGVKGGDECGLVTC